MKKRIGHIFLILVGLTAAVVASEFILRYLHPFDINYSLRAPYRFSCFRIGTYYWVRFVSNKTCLLHSQAGAFPDITFSFNAQGLRNKAIDLPKPPDRQRILFIGDSFIAGWGVREDQALPQKAESLLHQLLPGRHIETINAGLTGSGPGYYYLYLLNEGLALDPDIIVVGFYPFNDLAENIRDSEWTDKNGDNLPESIRSKTSYIDYDGNMRRYGRPLKRFFSFLEQSYLYDLTTDLILRLIPQPYGKASTIAKYCVFKESCHELDREKEITKSLFLAMHKAIQAKGKKLIILLIPAEFQITTGKRTKYAMPVALSPSDKAYPNKEFNDFFHSNGIETIDLSPPFLAHTKQSLYYDLDDHWTPEGSELAAQTVTEYLLPLINNVNASP